MKRICLWSSLVLAPALIGISGCATALPRMPERVESKSVQSELGQARLHEQQGQVAQARELYEDILKRNKHVVEAHQRVAIIAARAGDFATADKHFQLARQLQPKNATLLSDIAYAQCAAGELERAEQTARAALAVEPGHKRAQNNLAIILGRQGRFDESFLAFRKASSEAEAHANVAALFSQAGSLDKARQHYRESLALDDTNHKATQGLLQLHDLEQTLAKSGALARKAPASEHKIPLPDLEQAGTKINELTQTATTAPEDTIGTAAQAAYNVISQADQSAKAETSQVASKLEESAVEEVEEIPAVTRRIDDTSVVPENSSSESSTRRSIPEPEPRPVVIESESAASSDAIADQPVAEEPVNNLVSRCPAADGAVLAAVERLDAGTPVQQMSALRQLEKLGSAAKAAAPACREMLNNPDADVRVKAAVALWKIEGETAACLPHLCAGLASSDSNLSEVCAWTLGEMGAAAETALPALTKACSQSEPHACILAAEAIAKIQPGSAGAVDTLIRSLTNDDSQVRLLAAYAVAGIAPQDKDSVLSISHSLKDDDERVRAAAAFALGQIGSAASSAISALEACRNDASELVRSNAELALGRINGSDASTGESTDTQ
ncbi:MAG: HEAT repeat domain-containing protein [Planctomycetales bacterium]|nr:HEAT repeat domain-containing protein [Planctomycetales bacterium]